MSSALHSVAFPKNYKLNDMISFLEHHNIKQNKGGAKGVKKDKKIYYGAQRELKKTERRPTQAEAFNAHQIRYWGLNQISQGLKQLGLPLPKKLMKEIEKYKNMDPIKTPDKVEKYFKFIDDTESKLKLEKERIKNEEERLMKEAERIKEDEKILRNNAATKLQSLVRKRMAQKKVKALREAKKEPEEFPDPFPEDKYYPEEENVYDDEDQYEQDQADDEEEFMNQTIKDMPDFELLDTIKMLNDPNTPDKMKRNQIKTIKEVYNIKTLQEVEDEYKKRFEKKRKS